MKNFSIYVEVDVRNPSPEKLEELLTLAEMGDVHPAIGTSRRGYLDATITVPGNTIQQAIFVGVSTVQTLTGATAIRVDAMTEAEFDRRLGEVPMPELIGVTEAAEILGLSRQRVLQMIDEGKLAGTRIGKSMVLGREEVMARSAS